MPGSIEVFTEEFFKEPADLPPGDVIEVVDRVMLPAGMPPDTFRLAIGVVSEQAGEPAVRLAIKGRTTDGWYPLSEVEIHR